MEPPPLSPSGHPNMYGKMNKVWPANVHLDGLGPISDALIGRKKWSDLEVACEVDQLFRGPHTTAASIWKYVQEFRERARAAYLAKFALIKDAERQAYSAEKSYFYNRGDMTKRPEPDVERDSVRGTLDDEEQEEYDNSAPNLGDH